MITLSTSHLHDMSLFRDLSGFFLYLCGEMISLPASCIDVFFLCLLWHTYDYAVRWWVHDKKTSWCVLSTRDLF